MGRTPSGQRVAVYPGSFDPITLGHLDILERALGVFDKVIVAIGANIEKNPLFDVSERIELIEKSLEEMGLQNVEVVQFKGIIAKYVEESGAAHIIRGLRAVSDFDYEFQIASVNRTIAPSIDSVFFMTDREYLFLSSSMIKDLASYGHILEKSVTKCVKERLLERFS